MSMALARPALLALSRLMHPSQPPTQSWKPKIEFFTEFDFHNVKTY